MTDSVRSKLPNHEVAISNVVTRRDKIEIDKKVETCNIRLSKFCKKNKIDIIDNKNLHASCLNYYGKRSVKLKKTTHRNITISYLNINSIRNKLNDLKILISDSVDILYIAEYKLHESFLNSEIALKSHIV